MTPAILTVRSEAARETIRAASQKIASTLGVAPLGEPTPIERRQRDVGQMRELEELAALLDRIAEELDHD